MNLKYFLWVRLMAMWKYASCKSKAMNQILICRLEWYLCGELSGIVSPISFPNVVPEPLKIPAC